MKTLISTILAITFSFVAFGQTITDQNPNFAKSLNKYELKKDLAGAQQSITQQETYEVRDWREVKAEEKELKAERRHELRKMRIERDAQNRRRYNNDCGRFNRYDRYNRNRYPYYNY